MAMYNQRYLWKWDYGPSVATQSKKDALLQRNAINLRSPLSNKVRPHASAKKLTPTKIFFRLKTVLWCNRFRENHRSYSKLPANRRQRIPECKISTTWSFGDMTGWHMPICFPESLETKQFDVHLTIESWLWAQYHYAVGPSLPCRWVDCFQCALPLRR